VCTFLGNRVHVDTTIGTKEKIKKAKLTESAAETSLLESNLFNIYNKKNRFIKKYNAYMIDYSIELKPVPVNLDIVSLNALMDDGLENMITNIKLITNFLMTSRSNISGHKILNKICR